MHCQRPDSELEGRAGARIPFRVKVAFYVALGLFFGGCFLANIACGLRLLLPGRQKAAALTRRLMHGAIGRWFALIEAWGICRYHFESVREGAETPRVWIMNHPTILDALYLIYLLPGGTCIIKQSIVGNPFYGCIARLADYLPNEAGPDLIRGAVERLERGEDVIIFPEGTRTASCRAADFKGGYSLIARRARVPIELLWIENSQDFLARDTPVYRMPPLPGRVEIRRIGRIEPDGKEALAGLRERVGLIYEKMAHRATYVHEASPDSPDPASSRTN